MVTNQEITDQFMQNIKNNPKKVNELTSETKKLLKKQKLDTSIKQQIQKITHITDNNFKIEYLGRTYMQTMKLHYN